MQVLSCGSAYRKLYSFFSQVLRGRGAEVSIEESEVTIRLLSKGYRAISNMLSFQREVEYSTIIYLPSLETFFLQIYKFTFTQLATHSNNAIHSNRMFISTAISQVDVNLFPFSEIPPFLRVLSIHFTLTTTSVVSIEQLH